MAMKNNGTIRFSMAVLLVCGCVFLSTDLAAAEKSKAASSSVQKNDTAKKTKATGNVISKEDLEKLTTTAMEKSGNPLMQAGSKWLGWIDKIKKVNSLVWDGLQAGLATNEQEFLTAWENAVVDAFGEGVRKNKWLMEQIRKIGVMETQRRIFPPSHIQRFRRRHDGVCASLRPACRRRGDDGHHILPRRHQTVRPDVLCHGSPAG